MEIILLVIVFAVGVYFFSRHTGSRQKPTNAGSGSAGGGGSFDDKFDGIDPDKNIRNEEIE
jgi:hypothetical protein